MAHDVIEMIAKRLQVGGPGQEGGLYEQNGPEIQGIYIIIVIYNCIHG